MILGILSITEFFSISVKICKNKLSLFISNFFFIFFIFFFCLIFLFASSYPQLKILLTLLLIGCISSDIGGYVFGKIFGGPKLIKKISPNKTFSGAIGSIIFSTFTICFLVYYFNNTLSIKLFLLGIITSIACQIGDLIISFLKRKAKIKDSGNLLPGHGGILDRLDGIFLGIPLGILSFILIY
tara:strand:- start:777 stop:1328 length:552 start_codon:yes stop_codon:yes gene_type:complete